MTLDELRRTLALIKCASERRTEIYRVLISPQGKEIRRVHRGFFRDKHRSHDGEHSERETQ